MIKTHLLFVIALTFLGLTLIYYTTYLNLIVTRITNTRNTLTAIRVLSINRCVDPEWKLLGIVDGEEVAFTPRTIETNCPWGWAPGCLYSSYVFDASVETSSANSVILSRNDSEVVLPLHRLPSRSKGTLSLCVPPIYWFTDWIKLIFFMETWRVHGASHVFVYYHSSTLNVREVLRHYEREGFVTIITWPLLPSSSDVDPNRSLYRLAHSLAHNDCVLRLNSEFGALVDIDELIVPRNGSLLSLVMQRFSSSPSLGALSFSHRTLLLDPPLAGSDFTFEALDFMGISNAEEVNVTGPPKIPAREAVLLHNRYTNLSTKNSTPVELFPFEIDIDEIREAMITQKTTIFPMGADFHYETQQHLGICLQRWRKTQNFCKTPILGCQNALLPLENWYFSEALNQFHPL